MIVCAKCYEIVNPEKVQDAWDAGRGYVHKCGRRFFKPKGENRWDTKQSTKN